MTNRLTRLYDDVKKFNEKLVSVSDTELGQDYYRAAEIQMKTLIGRIMGDMNPKSWTVYK